MTTLDQAPPAGTAAATTTEPLPPAEARGLLAFLTTTDHKRIGVAYMVTAYVFFLIGGALAGVIRAELYSPGNQIVSQGRYNELFTMHGSIMLFLFLGPFAFGLANYFVPLHIGARDMAFPRLNALSYWFFVFGGVTMLSGFLTADGAADFGWTGYAPLSEITRSPSVGSDLWVTSLVLTGLSGVLTAVNIVATVVSMRAPGMRMFRMPIFTWNMLVTSVLVLMAFPVLTAAAVMLFADRHFGAHIYEPSQGGSAILWQHLFWFFGHPEVYILVLPFFGVITEILPVFSWRPVFGYAGLVFATIAIAGYSVGVWAHHMFTTGAVLLPFFTGFSMLIAVPTGVKFFNWIGTLWGGRIVLRAPMLFAFGFLFTFLLGGISGVMLASAPIDFHVHDSYFVVAHFHYVLFGGSVFALYAGIYYWFPKVTGRVLDETLGRWHFWMTLVGFHLTFFVQHILGLEGMPRRVADYLPEDGFTGLNRVSSIGTALLGASTLPFLWNVWRTLRGRIGEEAGPNPWGGHTLEWATASPPPAHNFDGPLPPIRSNRPVWDALHGTATADEVGTQRTSPTSGGRADPTRTADTEADITPDAETGVETEPEAATDPNTGPEREPGATRTAGTAEVATDTETGPERESGARPPAGEGTAAPAEPVTAAEPATADQESAGGPPADVVSPTTPGGPAAGDVSTDDGEPPLGAGPAAGGELTADEESAGGRPPGGARSMTGGEAAADDESAGGEVEGDERDG